MREKPEGDAGDAQLQRLLENFSSNPTDVRPFAALEEHLYLAGDWRQLASTYECRLSALPDQDPERLPLLVRLGGLLEQHLDAPDAAIRRYQELLQLAPQHPEGLASLRHAYVGQNEIAQALQIAELEERLEQSPRRQARTLAQIAGLWQQLGDAAEAERRFARALELDPDCDAALAGQAALASEAGDREGAVALHERRLERLRGGARFEALEQLAQLLDDDARVREILREILKHRPDRLHALRKLITLEHSDGNLDASTRLQRRLWSRLREPSERVRFALEAATEALGCHAPPDTVQFWLELAAELAGDDPRVHELRARLFRRTSRPAQVIHALEALNRIEGPSEMRDFEIGALYERDGRPERAIDVMQILLASSPSDREVLALLDRCLARVGRDAERAELLERRIALAEDDDEHARLSVELGDLYLDTLDDPVAAEEPYRRALARGGEQSEAASRLKQLYEKLERYDDLDRFLAGAARLAQAPAERARELCELGRVRRELRGDWNGAREAFVAALEAEPGCAPALEALQRLGPARPVAAEPQDRPPEPPQLVLEPEPEPASAPDAPLAEPAPTKATEAPCAAEAEPPVLERDPEVPPSEVADHAHLRGLTEAARESGDLARAQAAAQRWAELSTAVEAHEAWAEIARERGDAPSEQAALEALATLESRAADHASCLGRLGELALASGEPDALERACLHYREALSLDPTPALRIALMELCQRAGLLRELAELLSDQIQDPESPESAVELRVRLARTLSELGLPDRAIQALQPAFERDPSCAEVANLLESLLADQQRLEDLCAAIARRLERERDPARRRELAHRLGSVLLDGLERPDDAVAALRELADPSRPAPLEQLFERALESCGAAQEQETWLLMREDHLDGSERVDLLLRLASLQREAGRFDDAIQTLRRGAHAVPSEQLDAFGRPLLHLLRRFGTPEARLEVLEHLQREGDASTRSAFRFERARMLIDELGRPDEALADLDDLSAQSAPTAAELRQLAGLFERAGAPERRAKALEALATQDEDPNERYQALRELASLLVEGPETLRDPGRAAELVRQLLDETPEDSEIQHDLLALLEQSGDGVRLIEFLRARLASAELSRESRTSLSLRLAGLLSEANTGDEAAEVLTAARDCGAGGEAIDEALFRALADDLPGRVNLCAQKSQDSHGVAREAWLRRWLAALGQVRAPAEARLAVADELIAQAPDDLELVEQRARLLRGLERRESLARALETLLLSARLAPERHRLIVRELLRLYEGPLRTPERALALIERELEHDPSLRGRGIRIAVSLGDHECQVALLSPLAQEGRTTSAQQRQLGLALARLGRRGDAEPILWRLIETCPRDAEVLAALQDLMRDRDDPERLLRLLEARFALETAGRRAAIAQEGLRVADRLHDSEAALRWLRRWHAVDGLPRTVVERWVEMERGLGDRVGLFTALRVLRGLADEDDASAPVIAQEAALHAASGQLELARDCYEEALRLTPEPPCEWLAALDRILDAQNRVVRRSGVLRDLTRHPQLSAAERERYRELRADLLQPHPDLRAEAAAELRQLIAEDQRESPDIRVSRMRKLLEVYTALDCAIEWCEVAEALLPHLPVEEQLELDRALARKRTQQQLDRAAAITGWERVLAQQPEDREALEALVRLLDHPGAEAQRAGVLELLAGIETPQDPERWLAAGRLRWCTLRDALTALADLDAALSLDAELVEAHRWRAEICAVLGRADEEALSLEVLVAQQPQGDVTADRWLRLAELALAERERHEAAENAAERSLESATEPRRVRPRARAVFERVGAWPRACELLELELAEAEPDARTELQRRLAHIEWDERGRAEAACEALAALEQDLELAAEDCDRFADALAELARWPEAVARRALALERHGEAVGAEDWLELARLALARCDDAATARSACGRALDFDADCIEARSLRAELFAREGAFSEQLSDLVALGESHRGDSEAARALCQAATLAREQLGDDSHAWGLYRRALRREPGYRPALLGAGRIALEREEWGEAERMFQMALSLLREDPEATVLGEVARLAAEAALAQHRDAEAFQYLEQSLAVEPDDAESLDAMASLALRLGAHDRARHCLEQRLADGALPQEDRAERLSKLAQACEADDVPAAVAALERVIELRPEDEAPRARVVDLLEKLESFDRAVEQIDAWLEHAPEDERPTLELRAARLEHKTGEARDAAARLERVAEQGRASAEVWSMLAELTLAERGPEAALETAEQGLASLGEPCAEHGPLLWLRTRALCALGRSGEAAHSAVETLDADLSNAEAAQLLAQNLGRVGEWRPAVALLEQFLDVSRPAAPVEAELWEAVGRAYAGPLESMERAERCYRRALDANPKRATAREALADITAFDPGAHREAVELHRELLDSFPARPGSWRAIARIAEHWGRERAWMTALEVLDALRLGVDGDSTRSGVRPLIHTGDSENAAVRAATALLAAQNEANLLPDVAQGGPDLTQMPIALRVQLVELAGPGWDLDDEALARLLREPVSDSLLAAEGLSRRRRRDLQRALKTPSAEQLRALETSVWREELLAQAAARAVDQGTLSLADALRALLAHWPATAELDLAEHGNPSEAVQLCPPARSLLLRVADTTLGSLGLQ